MNMDLLWLATQIRGESVERAQTEADFFTVLMGFEMSSPLSGAAAECPYFVLMPPTLKAKRTWPRVTSGLGLEKATLNELFRGGFMPLDLRLFAKKSVIDVFESVQLKGNYTLIDLDYGIILLPRPGGMGSFGLDKAMLHRYQQVNDHYKDFPEKIFSVGAIYGHVILTGSEPQIPIVLEFDVFNRSEVDNIVERIRDKISSSPLELWFRGQTNDYILPDMRELASAGLCPWRGIQDTSLVPNLYRNAWNGKTKLKEYCQRLHALDMYTLFMTARLRMTPFEERHPDEPPIEKLSAAWGSYSGGMTVTHTDGENDLVKHDYHPAFYGLQQSFFLQHYGLPSNLLDVTHDLDVGLFFAQNYTVGNGMIRTVDFESQHPVLYIFLLYPQLDRFLDSKLLSEHYHLERPIRQKCGILCGASFISRNYYARYIAVKLHLRAPIAYSERLTPDYIYPGRDEDQFLDDLLNFQEREGITELIPFVLASTDKSS